MSWEEAELEEALMWRHSGRDPRSIWRRSGECDHDLGLLIYCLIICSFVLYYYSNQICSLQLDSFKSFNLESIVRDYSHYLQQMICQITLVMLQNKRAWQ